MKKRSKATVTGNVGVTAVRDYCDQHNLIFQAEPREDFGVDAYIEVGIDESPQSFIVAVQIKSGPSHRYDRQDGTFNINVRESDAAYWLAANVPVIFVYCHESGNQLYFHHIQAVFESAGSIAECTSLSFSDNDRAADGRLAEYVRALALSTPRVPDRFQVLSGAGSVVVGDNRTKLEVSAGKAISPVTFDSLRMSNPAEAWKQYPMYPRVLGYSRDGRWACESRFVDCGPRDGFDAEIAFVDLQHHSQLRVPIFTADELEESYVREGALDVQRVNATVDHLNRVSAFLNLVPASVLYDGYDQVLHPDERSAVALEFGGRLFRATVDFAGGRDTLVLRADAFNPPRLVSLLVERAPPAMLLPLESGPPWDEDQLRSMMTPQRFEYVAGIWTDADASLITFGVMTADTHHCWGTRAVHLAHFSVGELRLACAESLG